MRSVINISLPKSMAGLVGKEGKTGKFAKETAFVRHTVRLWNTHKLAEELKDAQKDFEAGKFKKLRSLKDLM